MRLRGSFSPIFFVRDGFFLCSGLSITDVELAQQVERRQETSLRKSNSVPLARSDLPNSFAANR
jgi:hypothetical protein